MLSSGQNEPVDDTGVGKHSIFGISFITIGILLTNLNKLNDKKNY